MFLWVSITSDDPTNIRSYAGADPGFPVGRRGPPMRALFGENVKTKELGPVGGGGACAGKL